MPAFDPVSLGLQAGSNLLSTAMNVGQYIGAVRDKKKAEEEKSRLKTPFYKIQDEYFQNRNLAAEMAQGGLPQATKDYLTEQTDRGLGTAISGIAQTGGSPNDFSKLFDSYRNSINQTAAQDAQLQLQNIQYYMGANKDLAGQKTTQWTLNEYQPYQNKLKEITERIAAAKMNKSNAIQGAIGSISNLGTAVSNDNLMGKMFNTGDPVSRPLSPAEIMQGVQRPTQSPTANQYNIQPLSFRPRLLDYTPTDTTNF